MKYFEGEKEYLINDYYNVYSSNYDTDHAFTKLVLSKEDKWLKFLLGRISMAQRPKPPFVYVIEDNAIAKAYLSYVSGRNSYIYITSTQMYHYKSTGEPDWYIEDGSIDLRTIGLYEPDILDSLMENNWLYHERLKDMKYYREAHGKQEFLNRATESARSHEEASAKINKETESTHKKIKFFLLMSKAMIDKYTGSPKLPDQTIIRECKHLKDDEAVRVDMDGVNESLAHYATILKTNKGGL